VGRNGQNEKTEDKSLGISESSSTIRIVGKYYIMSFCVYSVRMEDTCLIRNLTNVMTDAN
jgi:hypothetical protein